MEVSKLSRKIQQDLGADQCFTRRGGGVAGLIEYCYKAGGGVADLTEHCYSSNATTSLATKNTCNRRLLYKKDIHVLVYRFLGRFSFITGSSLFLADRLVLT